MKAVFRSYLSGMVLPPYAATTIMVEKEERIWILDKTEYLSQYTDFNSRRFMRKFIETSMFSVFYVNCFNWRWCVCCELCVFSCCCELRPSLAVMSIHPFLLQHSLDSCL